MALEEGYQLDEKGVRQLREMRKQHAELYRDRGAQEKPQKRHPALSTHHNWIQATSTTLDGTANAYPAKIVLHNVEANTWSDFTTVWLRFANDGKPSTGIRYWCRLEGVLAADGVTIYTRDDSVVTARKNSGSNVGTRSRLNFIEGSNVTLTVADDNTDKEIDITIAAASSSPAFSGASAFVAGDTINNATYTAITFTLESWDSDAYHDNSTNPSRMTIPSGHSGFKYLLSGVIEWPSDANGYRELRLYSSGSQNAILSRVPAVNGATTFQQFVYEWAASVGEYAEIYGYQNSGSNLTLASGRFTIHRLW